MKAILMSIKPKWVAKILNGEKTIEIRKTAPKCELPIDVYIYCTKGDYIGYVSNKLAGKVVAKFTLRKISKIESEMRTDLDDSRYPSYFTEETSEHELLENAFLKAWEIHEYLKCGKGYAWHISDLQIFDEQKELDGFYLKKAPQSWSYVEETKKEAKQ